MLAALSVAAMFGGAALSAKRQVWQPARAAAGSTAGLSRRQLAGQRVIFGFPGTRAPRALLRRIARGEAAGVILFRRNIRSRAQLRALTASLQRHRPRGAPPLIVAIDQEGGLVKRLAGAPRLSPAQLGARGDAGRALAEGRATARNLRAGGVNVNLAPVLDVGRAGTIMRRLGRSYSQSPAVVTRVGGAFARGLQSRGVAAAGKHFPGLGLARADEDLKINRVAEPLARLRAIDEQPYAKLSGALGLVMVSTGRYPALDGSRPALFSHKIAATELRGHTRFRGVAISDDLEVPALARFGSPARRGRLSARAGVDLLLFAQKLSSGSRAAAALAREPRGSHLAAVDRILALRRTLGRSR